MKKRYYVMGMCLFILGLVSGYLYFRSERVKEIELLKSGGKSMNAFGPTTEELKSRIITKGDTIAYKNLRTRYLDIHFYGGEFVFYSIIMADKYNYSPAYFDVYRNLTEVFEHNISVGRIDDMTKEMALKYLFKAVKLNEYDAICKLRDLYLEGKYVSKDTVLANRWAKKAEAITPILQR